MASRRLATVTGGLLLLVGPISAQQPHHPAQAPPAAQVATAPAGDVERGRYIVEQVAMCAECHSSRDSQGNIVSQSRLMGGAVPVAPPWPSNWANRAPRIAGLPGYTDEMIVKLLGEGAIGRDGKQLKLPMPRFRMTPQDAMAVAAYLRSLR